MRESPRIRRLRADFRALSQLQSESSILDFTVPASHRGAPPESYTIVFHGKGFWRPAERSGEVLIADRHQVSVQLGASYPRMMPELAWQSPIFHPNISASGVVCLGGYSTHWVPSLNLHELCEMLWDMIRFQNYDVESPYNREAALWARDQKDFALPIDPRPIRDKVAGQAPFQVERKPPVGAAAAVPAAPDVTFVDAEIVDAEVVEPEDPDILFIE